MIMSAHDGLPRQFYDMLLESQWWSTDELRSYQRSQLRQLLRHAKENVPFYEHRLDAVLSPNGDIDWDRWREIPIVKRQDIVDHGHSLLARQLPPGHGTITTSSTSGMYGAPITLTSTRLAQVADEGNRFRCYQWHNVDWTRDCCTVSGDEPGDAPWPEGTALGPWGPSWDVDALDGTLVCLNGATPHERVLEFLARKRPAYLASNPNAAHALALSAKRLGAQVKLEAFLTQGTPVSDPERAALSEIFGARSIDLYSSTEAGHIAHPCPSGSAMHINAESMLVEILDDSGAPVPLGVRGHVVLTPLFNAAQPLIRYDQGDLASWAAPCACGRHLPTISRLVGRAPALPDHPDGSAPPWEPSR
jgi:phenylacetate-CoA ligase